MEARFVNMSAAGVADALVPGGIIVPEFQTEIVDLVRRAGVLGQRIEYVPATGSPSRFFEQTAIADGQFTDPHAITPTATAPTRIEKSLAIKALTNRIDYSLFDLETVAQQGVFTQLKAKDLKDMVNGMLRLRDKALWNGTDTVSGGLVGQGATTQYCGLVNQITNVATILNTASIIDSIRTQVATLVNQAGYAARPTAIYMNPLGLDYLEQEAKNADNAIRFIQNDVATGVAGISVTGIVTAAGVLPIIPEPFLLMDQVIPGITAATGGLHNYPYAVLTESMVEFHWIGSKEPRVYQLGTLANLNESYVGIQFGAPVVKGPSYAHYLGVIQK